MVVGCSSQQANEPSSSPSQPTSQSQASTAAAGASGAKSDPEPPAVMPATPPAALTPLPTTAQVQESVSRGRVDPFAPLTGASGGASASVGGGDSTNDGASTGLSLQGVLAVGSQVQALVRTASGSGPVCLGPAGRCEGVKDPLLPKDWSVLSIDLQRGCLTYAVDGKAQAPVCLEEPKA